MTQNQIAYWTMQEQKRANRMRERETERSNLEREQETRRSNVRNESLKEQFQSAQAKRWENQSVVEAINAGTKLGETIVNSLTGMAKTAALFI